MSEQKYSKEFRREAVKQVVVLEHSVASVSDRLGIPEDSLNQWVNTYIKLKERVEVDELSILRKENRRLKKELKSVRDELDVLRRARRASKRGQ
ncbi:MAG: transposase [Gammaproteobacteria bacterium]|nr:transposase [Gammaproteobacteria bacterium]